MRILVVLLALFVCPLVFWLAIAPPATPAPPTVPPVVSPRVEISADVTRVQVGGTLTLSGVPVNIGLPYYTLTLSSGASATVTYSGEVRGEAGDGYLSRDDLFEIVSAQAAMGEVTFLLRALAPGSAEAVISATGEVRSAEGAFMWGGGASIPLTLTITE